MAIDNSPTEPIAFAERHTVHAVTTVDEGTLRDEMAGLDALEQHSIVRVPPSLKAFRALWPKVAAIALVLGGWQLVVQTGWKPRYVLPGPNEVLPRLWHELGHRTTWSAIATTLRRGLIGFALALAFGLALGLAVSRWKLLRSAVGSMVSGLQTMPSIAWFPLALVLFSQSEGAIYFVVVIGAGPSIANGLITGIDHIPPLLLRAGSVLGAKGIDRYRHIVIPAATPTFIAGIKQGWAFCWRSLMAGELLVIIANKPSIGSRLQFERDFADYAGMMAWMLIIFVIGITIDTVAFSSIERRVRSRRGLGV